MRTLLLNECDKREQAFNDYVICRLAMTASSCDNPGSLKYSYIVHLANV